MEAGQETPDRVWNSDAKKKLGLAMQYALAAREVLLQVETTRTPMARVSAAIDEMSMAIHHIDMAAESEDHCAERELSQDLIGVTNVPKILDSLRLQMELLSEETVQNSRLLASLNSAKPRRASGSRTGATRSSRTGKAPIRGNSSSRSEGRRSRSIKPRASSGRASRRKGG